MIWAHLSFLVVSGCVTVGVGHSLHRHGRFFLVDVFHGDASVADAVNNLLLTGFYLLNAAMILFYVKSPGVTESWQPITEMLAGKLGDLLMILGLMHFNNLAVLIVVHRTILRRRA